MQRTFKPVHASQFAPPSFEMILWGLYALSFLRNLFFYYLSPLLVAFRLHMKNNLISVQVMKGGIW